MYWKNLNTGELKVVDMGLEVVILLSLAISADGMKVAFLSDANPQPMHIDWVNNFDIENAYGNDMVPGVELAKYSSVYVKDMSSGEVKLVNTSDTHLMTMDMGHNFQSQPTAIGRLLPAALI